MSYVVPITGKVNYNIVLDPSSWIFDHRKIEWNDYIHETVKLADVLGSRREERAGAAMPHMIDTGVKYNKGRWLTDSFVIPVLPFLNNAEPKEGATTVRLAKENGEEETVSLEIFKSGVLGFSKNGKIIQEDGPLHFYDLNAYKTHPITGISKIIID